MDAGAGPAARRRYLGKRLRALRGERSSAEVMAQARISQPTLSRIEGGRGTIVPRNVASLLRIYGVPDAEADRLMDLAVSSEERGWWESYSDIIGKGFEIYASLEPDAAEIWMYQAEFVPGLFQTADVLAALHLALRPELAQEEIDRLIELRMERQSVVRARVTAVVNEAVLHRPIGSPEVWRAQLTRLRAEAERGQVRVLPFSAGAHPAMAGAFSMLKFDDFEDTEDMDLVYVATERGSMYFEKPGDLIRYGQVFTRVRDMALSPEESADLLTTLGRE
ncbi:helix-turn-helix domain-containing protein [Actinokineospora iranica]|uniref:Helix-turn-helix domain-containing protein n=1 Tax=Actinokineospora iranica TaxID=1271860 RepID=A0A1G6P7B3_9PSEU|nr:helix-turn-helix transcriptional regulator [Actinokineospora iranica]SDC75831.1 Helix-turn-helix domain-containing protein [Actinokineospora iranica]